MYGVAERAVLGALWRLGEYPCGRRLVSMVPLWLPAYEARHGPLTAAVRQNLARISPASVDRLLAPLRARVVRRRGGKYQLISGERRLRAALRAGWTQIPAQVREADDRLVAELAIVENLQ